jgi:hypothetical protein
MITKRYSFKQIVKRRFGGNRRIQGFFLALCYAFKKGIKGKPVAEICPIAFRRFFNLAFRAAGRAVMPTVPA